MQVTYLDPEDAAPKIEWQGVTFRALVPIDLDEVRYAPLIQAARTHPHFRVEGAAEEVTQSGEIVPRGTIIGAEPAGQQQPAQRRDPTPADCKWVLDYLLRLSGIEPPKAVAASGTAKDGTIAPGGSVSHSSPPGDKQGRGRAGRFMKAADLPAEPEPATDPQPPEKPSDAPWST